MTKKKTTSTVDQSLDELKLKVVETSNQIAKLKIDLKSGKTGNSGQLTEKKRDFARLKTTLAEKIFISRSTGTQVIKNSDSK